MTKAPRAGNVKTRLVQPLTPNQAAELNRWFLRDTARAISGVGPPAVGVAVYTPIGAEAIYADVLPPDFFLVPRRGNIPEETACLSRPQFVGADFNQSA
jgi:hypothetical protein